jgi:hypothetical protein
LPSWLMPPLFFPVQVLAVFLVIHYSYISPSLIQLAHHWSHSDL